MRKQQITMEEIPFAPVAGLCDTVPPVAPPPAPAPYKRPVAHALCAWRNDGGALQTWRHETLESAQAAAGELHFAVYWKYAIQCGRDLVEVHNIDEPADYIVARDRWLSTIGAP
jgi:hypothetical protein